MTTYKNIHVLCFALALVSLPLVTLGCSARHGTTVTTTESATRNNDIDSDSMDRENRTTVTETKVEEAPRDNHKGFFGIIGDILALPFRAIASIL